MNLATVLTSKAPHAVVRVWLFIQELYGGAMPREDAEARFPGLKIIVSEAEIFGVLTMDEKTVVATPWPEKVRTRKRTGAAPTKGDELRKLRGFEQWRFALKNSRSKDCARFARGLVQSVGRRYATLYEAETGRVFWPARVDKNAKQFREIALWCAESDVSFASWFEFCIQAYKRVKGVSFPAPSNMAGPWVRARWDTDKGKESNHAGHTYEPADKSLKARLVRAGFAAQDFDEDTLGHLEVSAKTKKELPSMYAPDPDEEIEKIVNWLASGGA